MPPHAWPQTIVGWFSTVSRQLSPLQAVSPTAVMSTMVRKYRRSRSMVQTSMQSQDMRFWFEGGLFIDGFRALKRRGVFAFLHHYGVPVAGELLAEVAHHRVENLSLSLIRGCDDSIIRLNEGKLLSSIGNEDVEMESLPRVVSERDRARAV